MLEELKTFIAVVEHKNFTKAGEHLNLSQPSVSTHIKNLENHFNTTLVNRSIKQKSIFITENGHLLYKRGKEILNLIDTTYMDMHNTESTVKGFIKVGASMTIGEYILPEFLAIFSEKYPDIDVEIFINNTASICSNLKELTLDIGLIEGTCTNSNFTLEYFLEDKMVLAFPVKEGLLSSELDYKDLNSCKWIVREEGSGTREFLDMFLSSHKIIPDKVITLGSNYAVKEAVKNNLGITIISDLVTKSSMLKNEITTKDLGNSYTRYFSYIYPKDINISKACNVFLEELKLYSIKKSRKEI